MSATLVSLWTDVRRRLEAAGVDTPVLDARLLLEAGAGVSRLDIVADPRRVLSAEQIAQVDALTRRREAREPVSHIVGRKAFWKIELAVSRDVLTPRPETEFLVEAALDVLPSHRPARILDLGVGSGAILLALLAERPLARGVGVDISEAALGVARANTEALGLESRTTLHVGDWAEGLQGPFDLVVSNPPYIATAELAGLDPEVLYEPRLALDGGADGFAAYRTLCAALPGLLAPGGRFAFEVGRGQAEEVGELARAQGLSTKGVKLDLAGTARVVLGERQR